MTSEFMREWAERSLYYDRKGRPIGLFRYARMHRFERYLRVGDYLLLDGLGRPVRISTVWLGIDHSFTPGRPVIFETMVFGGGDDGWQDRYCTEEEAKAGHRRIVEALRQGRKLSEL